MFETLITLGIAGSLLALTLATRFVPWNVLLATGAVMTAVGFFVSVGIGIGYHLALYSALNPSARLPPRWWLSPSSCHGLLLPNQKRSVFAWYYAGVTAVTVTLIGCGIMLIASFMALQDPLH